MPSDLENEEFLQRLVRGQLRLSVSIAMVFGAVLLGLPLANYLAPEWMSRRVAGFPLNWLLLGVLVFPLVWLLSWIFLRASTVLEKKEGDLARDMKKE